MKQLVKNNAWIVLLIGILILIIIMIFRKPEPINNHQVDLQPYRDSIAILQKDIDIQKAIVNKQKRVTELLKRNNDSLSHLPAKIKIIYEKQKKFIPTATVNQLDSVIRSNTGI